MALPSQLVASAIDVIELESVWPVDLVPATTRAVGLAARKKPQGSHSTIFAVAASLCPRFVWVGLAPPFDRLRGLPRHLDAQRFACLSGPAQEVGESENPRSPTSPSRMGPSR